MTSAMLKDGRGRLRNYAEPFRELVYSLLYPGVLGSMLFDLFDPVRLPSLTQIALICIAILFCLDYLHLRFNLGADTNENSRPLIDGVIAIAYCFGYFTLSATTDEKFEPANYHTYEIVSLLYIFGALGLATYYQFWASTETKNRVLMGICTAIPFVGAVVLYNVSPSLDAEWFGVAVHSLRVLPIFLLAAVAYGFYALERARPNVLHQSAPRWADIVITVVFVILSLWWIFGAPRRSASDADVGSTDVTQAIENSTSTADQRFTQ